MDEGIPVDAVYLDFQKAFDKVSHSKLLSKMDRYGIDKGVVRWVRSWLSGRRQRVVIDGVASGWELVLSGVPQGSVLGPVLFIVFIDDIDEGIRSTVLKFADDTKLVARVGSEEDRERLRQDLVELYKWSEDWQMLFNLDKCSVMHFGFANKGMEVRLGDKVLGAQKSERDLGVIMQSDLKVDKQCSKAANEANKRLGMIHRNFKCKAKKVILPLYKSIVRPHLDYCVQAWRPHYRKDVDKLEKVQRRATKMVEGLEGYSYEDRLRILGLTTLETRFLRADLIEVFKILRGFENLDPDRFFQVVGDGVRRGHSFKLFKKRYRLDVGKFKFASRVCEEWNSDLRRIRNTLDHKTACTIATSLIHSKLDYCNSLYLNISNQQLNRLQLILNSAARAVTKTPKFHHITPHLKSLHWLKITQRIQYKILSLTYKSLQYNNPSSISDLLTIQPTRSTRSSAVVTLQRPSNPSRLKISDRSFYFQAPALWNALPHHLRSHSHSSESHSLLSLSSSQFHKQLKTHLFLHSYPP